MSTINMSWMSWDGGNATALIENGDTAEELAQIQADEVLETVYWFTNHGPEGETSPSRGAG